MDRRDTLAAAFRRSHFDKHDSRGLRSRERTPGIDFVEVIALPSTISSAFDVHIERAMQHGVAGVRILRANRFAMTGQQSLPQLVVYGNPVRGCGDERPEAPIVCKFWRLGALWA